jgi:endonuclease/exonuclease/phosphatase family metal-dependent hydrolase
MTGDESPDRVRHVFVPLGTVLLVDVLRVWLPSIITVFGQAASTPTELLGAFALAWFVIALPVPWVVRAVGERACGVGAALVLAGCRLALVGTTGQVQLYVASVGLFAGVCWLVSLAVGRVSARGVGVGIAAAALLHAALGTVDLTWRGWWGWAGAGAMVLLFGVTLRGTGRPARSGPPAGGGGWFLVGPVLLLAGQVALNPAVVATGVSYLGGGSFHGDRAGVRGGIASSVGWVGVIAEGAVVAAAVLAFGYLVVRPPARRWAVAVCGVVLVGGALCFGYGPGGWLPVVVPLTAAALGGCAGAAWRRPAGDPLRSGLAAAGGMLLFATAVLAYYAAYDLGYPNGWVPATMAVGVAAAAIRAAAMLPAAMLPTPPTRPDAVLWRRGGLRGSVVVAAVVLAGSGAAWGSARPAAPSTVDSELRVVAYNVRMAFGLDGRFSVARAAAVIRAERPDVVLLSEVDRGWLLNGGHDDLRPLARALGMRYVFAPAADALWGDAILTNLPVESVRTRRLPEHGAPTGAQALAVVLRHGDSTGHLGRTVAVIATHLQPPPDRPPLEQARALAAFANGYRTPGRPVIIGGDLNTEPGDPPFEVLVAAGFADAFAAYRPVRTSPADAPRTQIDHVLVAGAGARDVRAPRSTASDHLPVAVTIDLGES